MHAAVMIVLTIIAKDPRTLPGWPLYDRLCLACHGANGDGRGPAAAFTWGDPRAFAKGSYEWRSTPIGQPPTTDDLRTSIRYGASGTSMPGFALTDREIDQLIEILRAFEPSAFAKPGKPIAISAPPAVNPARGAELWTKLGCDKCHGASGRGDVAGQTDPPYDLAKLPLRRPRAYDDATARRRAAMISIATGMTGTPMPGYAGTATDADLWALADHVLALGSSARAPAPTTIPDDKARATTLAVGTWPAADAEDARLFGAAIPSQGAPPTTLTPAQASLSAQQCARCHAKQAREWRPSVHAAASTWGLAARLADHATGACDRCHAPLAEQATEGELRAQGVSCAGCHVREWVRRGPPRQAPSLLTAPGYPLVELAIYERADFCMACHQLPPSSAVAGKPLLNTYKEWLEGPYMRRGIECQHCHMPNREHTWLGIHDRDTFRQGIRLDARARRVGGVVSVNATLANIGAGHDLPTTPTPAVWLRIELVDVHGRAIDGARAELRIGRDLEFVGGRWRENSDTRIAPGAQLDMTRAWQKGRVAEATAARVTVEVHPDAYYERLYQTGKQYATSLVRARASHYIAEQRDIAISSTK